MMQNLKIRYQIDPLIYKILGKPFNLRVPGIYKYCVVINSFEEIGRYYNFHISYTRSIIKTADPRNTKECKISIRKEQFVDCFTIRKLKSIIAENTVWAGITLI